jgi:hypothetical protein
LIPKELHFLVSVFVATTKEFTCWCRKVTDPLPPLDDTNTKSQSKSYRQNASNHSHSEQFSVEISSVTKNSNSLLDNNEYQSSEGEEEILLTVKNQRRITCALTQIIEERMNLYLTPDLDTDLHLLKQIHQTDCLPPEKKNMSIENYRNALLVRIGEKQILMNLKANLERELQ